jgi:exodeoxyribonuclease V beta subunit
MPGEFDISATVIPPGLSVIEASAGTGKTYAISHLVARMVLEGLPIEKILLVTYTRDAAGELAERTRQVLEILAAPAKSGEERDHPFVYALRTHPRFDFEINGHRIHRALRDIDLLSASTIHAFCQSVLTTEGALCGAPTMPELAPDPEEWMDDALYDDWLEHLAHNPLAARTLQSAKLSLSDHRRFLQTVGPLTEFEAQPVPQKWEDLLQNLQNIRQQFAQAECNELEGIFRNVTRWNKGRDLEGSLSVLNAVRNAGDPVDSAFLDACSMLAGAPKWIDGSSHRDLCAQIKKSRVVELSQQVAELLPQFRWTWLANSADRVRRRIEQSLQANHLVTYDGLVGLLHNALTAQSPRAHQLKAKLRARYKVALIDESQDTDPRQYEIFKSVFLGSDAHSLVLIGDPKQAIYGFRGADVNTYLAAKAEAAEDGVARLFPLIKTYRARQRLVDAVNAVFRRPNSLLKEGLDFAEAQSGKVGDLRLQVEGEENDARLEFWIAPDETGCEYSNKSKRISRVAGAVATEIVRILNSGGTLVADGGEARAVEPSDFAVLVSKHEEAQALHAALLARGVPAVQATSQDILSTDEAGELLAILRSVNEPHHASLRHAALTTRLLGRTDAGLLALDSQPEEQDRLLDVFLAWQSVWQTAGVVALLAKIDADEAATARLAKNDQAARRITNFRHLAEILAEWSTELGNKPNALLRRLEQEILRSKARQDIEERQLRLESDEDAVQISTMHAAKGLEYNLVFCPFLWDSKKQVNDFGKLNRSRQCPIVLDIGIAGDTGKQQLFRSSVEDRLRLAYVAITRARVKVWIYGGEVCGPQNRPEASALDWLLREDNPADFASWVQHARASGRGTRHAAGVRALMALAPEGCIEQFAPPEPSDEFFLKASDAGPACHFEAGSVTRLPDRFWRITSFSGLTREKNPKGDSALVLPPDTDENPVPVAASAFALVPGGATLGTAVHDFLEAWDFGGVPPDDALQHHFSRYSVGGGAGRTAAAVREMLPHLLGAELPGLNCPVAAACGTPGTSEWHFHLPVRDNFSTGALAAVFREHGDPGYADALADLGSEPLTGFLQGFIDKIVCHGGRYGVIDWKTNTLAAYDDGSLLGSARTSHYWLQTHLYLVALRRYLGKEIPLVGAWLVYLRGVQSGTPQGILPVRPSRSLLEDLDNLFLQPET